MIVSAYTSKIKQEFTRSHAYALRMWKWDPSRNASQITINSGSNQSCGLYILVQQAYRTYKPPSNLRDNKIHSNVP